MLPSLVPQEIEELEEESAHLATELAASFVPFAGDAEEEQEAATVSWKLPSIPAGLAKELDDYVSAVPPDFATRSSSLSRDMAYAVPAGCLPDEPHQSGAGWELCHRHYCGRGQGDDASLPRMDARRKADQRRPRRLLPCYAQ